MDWVYYILLLLVLFTGVVLNVLTLPGNWLMLVAVVIYDWVTRWRHVHWLWLVVLFVIAVVAEVVEFAASGRGVKQLGGTIWGTAGALVGGLVGGLFLTGLVPIPVVGTLAGIILGTFLGAMAAEFVGGKEALRSAAIGYGAAKGRVYGTLLKIAAGCLLLLLALVAAFPTGRKPGGATPVQAPPVAPAKAG